MRQDGPIGLVAFEVMAVRRFEPRGKIVAAGESALIGDGTVVVLGWRALMMIMTWTNVFYCRR